ncbi:hypothetical protein Tco_1362309 [Tanacetum coccineum]
MIVISTKFRPLSGISHWGKSKDSSMHLPTTRNQIVTSTLTRRIIAALSVTKVNSKKAELSNTKDQDIDVMLLLSCKEKVDNLNVEERIAFNVSLRMFTKKMFCHLMACEDLSNWVLKKKLSKTCLEPRDKAIQRAMIQAIDKRLKTRRIMRSLERFVGGRPYGGDLRALYKGPYDLSMLLIRRFRLRYSDPMIQHREPDGITQGYPLVSVEVLRYDLKGGKCEGKGIMPTEMEANMETNPTSLGPSDAMHNLPSHQGHLKRTLVSFHSEIHAFLSGLSHSELVDFEWIFKDGDEGSRHFSTSVVLVRRRELTVHLDWSKVRESLFFIFRIIILQHLVWNKSSGTRGTNYRSLLDGVRYSSSGKGDYGKTRDAIIEFD